MKKILSDKRAIVLFLLPTLLVILLIIIIPILISFYYSLLNWDGIGKGTFIGIKNYVSMLQDERLFNAIKNSLIFAGLSLFIQLPFCLFLAILVANGVKGEKVYRTLFFIPVIISTVVIGQLWQKIYNTDYGLLNEFLQKLGLSFLKQDWLGQETTALLCSFIPILWQYVGYHMLIMYAGIKGISEEVNEAAMIDGATKGQLAIYITVPMLKPILKVCATFSLIGALKVFDLIYVLTGGGPFYSTEVPSIYMYTTIFDAFHYGYGSAVSIFIILECFVFTILLNLLFKSRREEA
ncbi:MAG: sugar ABC transporter permease [Lachnospiraceae bacterium]|nr:sugar ABC transporter permease [Lachnospiraceae bacterium]